MIEFSHVYKTYPGPVHALKNIDLRIGKGEFVFLTGPSGAGKTSLFKLISAFDVPTSGQIQVAGHFLNELKVSQLPYFRRLKDHTVFENVALPLEVLGERSAFIKLRVEEILEQVGLQEKRDQLPD